MGTATMRRVTPAAVQVLKADAPEWLWLAERRNGIGSSDIAKIVGVADRGQAANVYYDKRGVILDEEGEPALWGKLHEDTVAQEWCRRNRSVIRRVGLVANADNPVLLTTLDRLVRECPLDRDVKARCALEVKTRSAFKSAKWHRATPDDVLAQGLWQRHVTGLDHIHVAVLIGGNDYRQTVIRPDHDLEGFLVDEGTNFWHAHVKASVPPPWNYDTAHPDDLLKLDAALHPDRVGRLDLEGLAEVMEYADLSAAAGAAERARKAQVAKLKHLANGARYLVFDNEQVAEFAPRSKTKVDLELLSERFPDAYAASVSETHYDQIQLASGLRKGKS